MGEAAHSVSEWAGQALTELPRWRRELIFIGEVSMAQVDPIWKFPKVTVIPAQRIADSDLRRGA